MSSNTHSSNSSNSLSTNLSIPNTSNPKVANNADSKPKTSILALPEPWDLVSSGYVEVTQPMLAQYSIQALELYPPKSTDSVLDVACGPGTLSLLASPMVASVQGIDFSPKMLAQFEVNLSHGEFHNIEYQEANGQDLPFDDEEFDRAYSMFGLMFFPDRLLGLQELHRTLKPGGRAIITSWLPRYENPSFKTLMETIMHINPAMVEPPKITNPLELSENLENEMLEAGFQEIKIHKLTATIQVGSHEEFWEDMVKGNAPISMMKQALPAREWKKKSKKAVAYLKKNMKLGPMDLYAWLATGLK